MTCAAGYQVTGGTGNVQLFWGDDSKCTSSDGQGGRDCWAGCHGDPFSCAGGYTSVVGAETVQAAGQTCWKYTCLPSGNCEASKCTSPNGQGGRDCWAHVNPAIEPATCEWYGTLVACVVLFRLALHTFG